MPKVSVLMAVYNGEKHLRPALESLLTQTFEDFELVVVDDASTDRTPEILNAYEGRDGRLRVLRNASNRKLPASLNRGLKACNAPLVARADADDVYERDRIQKQYQFMRQNPDIGVLSSNVHLIDETGKRIDTCNLPLDHDAIRLQMNYTVPIRHPATMYRRNLIMEVGGYNEDAVTAQDVELWGRLVGRTHFANLEDPLVHWRRHDASNYATRGLIGKQFSLRTRQELLGRYLREEVDLEQADALHALLRRPSTRHSQAEVESGLKIAKKLREELRRRGLDDLRHEFERDLFEAICSQSIKHSSSNQSFGWHLLREAVRISPQQLGRIQGLKKIAAMIRG